MDSDGLRCTPSPGPDDPLFSDYNSRCWWRAWPNTPVNWWTNSQRRWVPLNNNDLNWFPFWQPPSAARRHGEGYCDGNKKMNSYGKWQHRWSYPFHVGFRWNWYVHASNLESTAWIEWRSSSRLAGRGRYISPYMIRKYNNNTSTWMGDGQQSWI